MYDLYKLLHLLRRFFVVISYIIYLIIELYYTYDSKLISEIYLVIVFFK